MAFAANHEANQLAMIARQLQEEQQQHNTSTRTTHENKHGQEEEEEEETDLRRARKKKEKKKMKRERERKEGEKKDRRKRKREREEEEEEERCDDVVVHADHVVRNDEKEKDNVAVPKENAHVQIETIERLKAAGDEARSAEFVRSVDDGDDAERAAAHVALRCAVLLRKSLRTALHMFVSCGATRAARERAAALLASPFAPLDASVTAEGSYADMELFRLVRAVVDMASEETAHAMHDNNDDGDDEQQQQQQAEETAPPRRRPPHHERSFKEVYLALYTSAFRQALPGEDDDDEVEEENENLVIANGDTEVDGGRHQRNGNAGSSAADESVSAAAASGHHGKRRKAASTRLRCAPEELMRCLQTDMDIFDDIEKALLTTSMRVVGTSAAGE